MPITETSQAKHFVLITLTFLAWKAILALVTYYSPGIGYDTSSSLLEDFHDATELVTTPSDLQHYLTKFVRWDAIYFTQIAARQYVFEQEWAFSFAFSKALSIIAQFLPKPIGLNGFQAVALSGVLLSHLAHLGSVFVLYCLTSDLYVQSTRHSTSVALGAAILHIISPAGMFLSAPYTESLFSLLNMLGFALYLRGMSRLRGHSTLGQRVEVIVAGLIFGVATTIRGNGLLSGLPFLYDAVARSWAIVNHGISSRRLYDLASLFLGGILIAAGFVLPQAFAYQRYCGDLVDSIEKQPWCSRTIPSIYTWVQEYYWNVGVLKYWTFSNIPLFLIATPMLVLLTYTSAKALWPEHVFTSHEAPVKAASSKAPNPDESALVRLALPQISLAVLAIFAYNVQIITRISSGYPLWYVWLAEDIVTSKGASHKGRHVFGNGTVFRFMVMYAIIQGSLFASFLPPA